MTPLNIDPASGGPPSIPFRRRVRSLWWNRLRPVWHVVRWPAICGLTLLTVLLGFIGFKEHFALLGEERSAWDCFYLSLQLFTLESGSVVPPIPLELEIARLLAPTIAVYAAVQALMAVLHEQWQRVRIRFVRNHVVICGLGQRGLRLLRQFCGHGYRVVVIEADESNPLIEQCHEQGAIVLIGDAMDADSLRAARVGTARYLVSVLAEDGANAQVAANALTLARGRTGRTLTAIVHIIDPELCGLLRQEEMATATNGSIRLEFLNVMEQGARVMLDEVPVVSRVHARPGRPVHLVVIGSGRLGRSLVAQAAKQWWLGHRVDGTRLRITVVDSVADQAAELLRLRNPRLEEACELVIRNMEKDSPEFERAGFLFDMQGHCCVDAVYLCSDDDVHVVAHALMLRQRTMTDDIPIVMRMTQDAGLAALLREGGDVGFANLHAVGLLDRTCTLEALLGGTHEVLARAVHESYVRHQAEAGQAAEANPSMTSWDRLPEHLKESNRLQADHIVAKLVAVGCGIAPTSDWEPTLVEFSPTEVELMARMEHERWYAERKADRWRYAPGPKDIERKTSPSLVRWEELDEEVREIDRNAVRDVPVFLAQAGFRVLRPEKARRR